MNISVLMKKPKVIWAFFVFAFLSQTAFADFYSEQIEPLKARAFDSTSQKILATGLGSMWLAQTQDSQARHQYNHNQTISEETADYGDNFARYGIGPAIALGQLYFDRSNGISHARALISTELVTIALKNTIQRRRPNGANNVSMPSGHTSTAFATATALTYSYGWKAGIWAYPLATFVGLSRMADDNHWLSDTVAGAFIGFWMGRASAFSTSETDQNSVSVQWIPVLQAQYQGLTVQFDF
jgi:membrane-associated phospholipid phosphatase